MPGWCFETSKWIDRLWSEHLQMSKPARDLVAEGVRRQGARFAGFGVDLVANLYLPRTPTATGDGPEWAQTLHEEATQLGEWQRLRLMCQRNGFASGIAAEVVLEQLLPEVPDRPELPGSRESPTIEPQPDDGSDTDQQEPRGGSLENSERPELRAALRVAARAARDAVNDAESSLEGVATPLGISMSGTAATKSSGREDLKAIRDAHRRLQGSKRLKRIAEIAGRLERVAAHKARSSIRPGVGEVHGIDLGADPARLLPSEAVGLRHPVLRTVLHAKLLEGRALVYGMQGREPTGRGPVIVLLDESSSMTEDNRDIWAKAVALALLGTATKQRRSWRLIAFNGGIRREVEVPAGRATAADVLSALDHSCTGGTDFSTVVARAVDVLAERPTMHNADVVLLTDGEDRLEPHVVGEANRATTDKGVSWFVVGVGPDAEQCLESLGPIATHMVRIAATNTDDAVVDVVNLDRNSPELTARHGGGRT